MKTNCIITASLIVAIAGMGSSYASDDKRVVPADTGTPAAATTNPTSPTSQAVTKTMEGEEAYYTVVEFDKGKDKLNESSKKALRKFIEKAQKEGREIDDIKIMAWADKEYPVQGAKVDKKDIKIAKERSEAIEDYLKDDLDTDGDYASFNMAKRPNKVNEFFKSDDYKTKKTFEESGSSPTSTSEELATFMNNKAGKALIMVDYE